MSATLRTHSHKAPMEARIRCKGMEVSGIQVHDLSLAGCMIATGTWLPREEQRVLVSLPSIPNLPGCVMWVENGRVGILFDQLLSETIFEHLRATYGWGGPD